MHLYTYTWGKCPFIPFLCFWRSLSLCINTHLLPSVPFTFPQRNVGCNLLPHPSHGEPLLPSWSVLAEILFSYSVLSFILQWKCNFVCVVNKCKIILGICCTMNILKFNFYLLLYRFYYPCNFWKKNVFC